MKKKNIYFELFSSTFYLSAFTIGGGYVIAPLMKKKFVDELNWLEEDEMLNIISLAQASPGAIATNASILIGYRFAGVFGAFITILGTILPPLIILSVISFFYTSFRDNNIVSAVLKGMQAGVVAVFADVIINMGANIINSKKLIYILIMVSAFAATTIFNVNVIIIIIVCGLIGTLRFFISEKANKRSEK